MANVDVVVPCYNYGRFLESCVRSVLEQSLTNVRVLIIDDASSDDSLAIATKLAEEDRRVSVISHAENWGHILTYNQGIEWACADYFLLLSADDFLLPGALARAATILDGNPDVVLTYGDCIVWDDDTRSPEPPAEQSDKWERQDLLRRFCERGDIDVYDATAIVRTSVQKKIGGYQASLPHCADLEMWLRFAAHGAVAYICATQAVYRKHACAMTKSYCFTIFGCQQRMQAFDTFFDCYGGSRPDFPSFQAKARRQVARLTFRDGSNHLRRGRINIGLQLIRLAFQQDPRLRLVPPLWWLFRFPGLEGRRWAAALAKRATVRLVRGAWYLNRCTGRSGHPRRAA